MKISNKKMTDEAIKAVALYMAGIEELPEDVIVSFEMKRLIDAFEMIENDDDVEANDNLTALFTTASGMFSTVLEQAQTGFNSAKETVKERINKPSSTEQRIAELEARVTKLEGESR